MNNQDPTKTLSEYLKTTTGEYRVAIKALGRAVNFIKYVQGDSFVRPTLERANKTILDIEKIILRGEK